MQRNILLKLDHLTTRALVQVDQWDRMEGGKGPDPEHLRERATTLIDILRALVRAVYAEEA